MVEHVLVVRGQGKVLLLMQKTQMLWLGDNKNSSLLTAGPAKPGGGGGGRWVSALGLIRPHFYLLYAVYDRHGEI